MGWVCAVELGFQQAAPVDVTIPDPARPVGDVATRRILLWK